MKITKRQLKRIIKEEKRKLLKEAAHGLAPGIGFANWEGNNRRYPPPVLERRLAPGRFCLRWRPTGGPMR